MISAEFPAMGTTVQVRGRFAEDLAATTGLFEEVEQVASRFRPDSELSALNDDPASDIIPSRMLGELVAAAATARSLTAGLVDAGVGNAVRDWGYDRTFGAVEDLEEIPNPIVDPAWTVDGNVLRRQPGTTIDLGGIAKGWTCDLAIERGLATMVNAGGDVRSADPNTTVEVLDPWGRIVADVQVGVGALATSSATRRRWRVADREAHHLIDPRTLSPSTSPILSATAVTSTAVEAEAAAKAILLLGSEGLVWADRQPWINGAIVVWSDGNVYATTDLEVAT